MGFGNWLEIKIISIDLLKNRKMKIRHYILSLIFVTVAAGCSEFLDKKSDQKLVVPSSLADIQAMLDDQAMFNQNEPNAPVVAADQYVIMDDAAWSSISENLRNMYLWQPNLQFPSTGSDNWSYVYAQVYNANIALDNLKRLSLNSTALGKELEAQCLFLRGKAFFNAVMIWTLPYDPGQAARRYGIPLRLDPNYNTAVVRASQEESFAQTISDLRSAAAMLTTISAHVVRPSKGAAYGYLARIFLAMGETDSCLYYTNRALSINSKLMDYNNNPAINTSATYPIARFNEEVLYDAYMGHPSSVTNGTIDAILYASYQDNDLRKTLFHRGAGRINYYRGSYSGSSNLFSGIATDELLLNKAECLARKDQIGASMNTLNLLLSKRYITGSFVPLSANDKEAAIELVLKEREKELVFRGLRWMDLKRLNVLGAGITLKRTIKGVDYLLPANGLAYAMPIPERTIRLTGMPQNEF